MHPPVATENRANMYAKHFVPLFALLIGFVFLDGKESPASLQHRIWNTRFCRCASHRRSNTAWISRVVAPYPLPAPRGYKSYESIRRRGTY